MAVERGLILAGAFPDPAEPQEPGGPDDHRPSAGLWHADKRIGELRSRVANWFRRRGNYVSDVFGMEVPQGPSGIGSGIAKADQDVKAMMAQQMAAQAHGEAAEEQAIDMTKRDP